MNDFQKKTIETAAAKVQTTKQAFEQAKSLAKSNTDLRKYYSELLRALEDKTYELDSNVEQTERIATEAKAHYDYVCKDFAGIPPKETNFFVHVGGQVRDAVRRW